MNRKYHGLVFHVSETATKGNTETYEVRLATPTAGQVLLVAEFAASGSADVLIAETTTKTHVGGNALTVKNLNRNSSNAWTSNICHTPGGSGDGTTLLNLKLGGGEGMARCQPLYLKLNTAYLIRVTSNAAGNALTVNLTWHVE